MMAIARVTAKFQLTIPGEIREVLNLDGGDRIVFQVKDNGEVTIRTLKAVSVDDLAGALGKVSSIPIDGIQTEKEQSASFDDREE